jgi:hypothetical protein
MEQIAMAGMNARERKLLHLQLGAEMTGTDRNAPFITFCKNSRGLWRTAHQ